MSSKVRYSLDIFFKRGENGLFCNGVAREKRFGQEMCVFNSITMLVSRMWGKKKKSSNVTAFWLVWCRRI